MTKPARVRQSQIERAIRAAKDERKVFIYFLRAGDFIKIGQSRRWKYRLAQMQTGSPYTIVPLLVLVDEPKLERRLHSRFKGSHFRGEWFFSHSPAIAAYIKENLHRCVAKADNADDLREPEREIIL